MKMVLETQWKMWKHVFHGSVCRCFCACLDLWSLELQKKCRCAIVKFYMTCNSTPFRNAKVAFVWQNTHTWIDLAQS